ncbi:MAG: DUF4983 domain-containing protein, partial [Flavobacteriales bacterium]|nr:DUF4983 domain-containing protein [Flavobacteriales bacterium]
AEVRIWDTLLSDNEVSEWACTSVDSTHPSWFNLASYWKMDDNENYLANASPNNPFLDASVNGAEWQIADSTVIYDYSGTPRLVDVPVTAMTHLDMEILPEWNLDGVSWVGGCNVIDVSAGLTSECVLFSNVYSQEINVTVLDPPATGQITLNGQDFVLDENNTSTLLNGAILATLVLELLVADGLPVDLNITFYDDVTCGGFFSGLFTAPMDCSCLNDVNVDGTISVGDILLVLAEFGCASACTADVTNDGNVNVSDLLSILSEFGQTCV